MTDRYMVRFDADSNGYFIHDTYQKNSPYRVDDYGLAINWYPTRTRADRVASRYNGSIVDSECGMCDRVTDRAGEYCTSCQGESLRQQSWYVAVADTQCEGRDNGKGSSS